MQWRDATVGRFDTTGFGGFGSDAARREPDLRQFQLGQLLVAGSGAALPAASGPPCTKDPELFFAESPQDVEQAKAICGSCRVRLACLAGALERREPCGVWGGELLIHGAIVPRKRPRGRPRKAEVAALARPARPGLSAQAGLGRVAGRPPRVYVGLAGQTKSRRQACTGVGASPTAGPCGGRPGRSRCYCGGASESRLLSSWISTATLASASACIRPWCAQNSSSPPLARSTRTYAWAPQRSQASSAVSGLVGAIAPVNVAFLASCLRLLYPSGPFTALPLSGTHTQALAFPPPRDVRHKRNHAWMLRFSCAALTRGAHVPPLPQASPAAHRHRVST